MSFIQFENVGFSYGDGSEPVFSGLTLRLDTDWKLALVGDNGRGKTTLLKLLSGDLKGGGRISVNTDVKMFPLKITDKSLTPYEIFCELCADTEFWKLQREFNLLELDEEILYRPYGTLSGGEQTKFQLAAVFAGDGFVLIDEPTDHLDAEGRKRVSEYLLRKRGFIAASHDRSFLSCCDHVLALEKGGVFLTRGGYPVYAEERDKRTAAEESEKRKLENERERLARAAARISDWGDSAERNVSNRNGRLSDVYASVDRGFLSARAARVQKRAASVADRYEKAQQGIKNVLAAMDETEDIRLQPEKFFRSELLTLKNVSVRASGKTLFSALDLRVEEGERIAVAGVNGCGKSTLLKLICGILPDGFCAEGQINIPARLKISYVPQSADYCGSLAEFAAERNISEGYFKAVLSKFGFAGKDLARDMRLMSEGQKKKAAIAASLCGKANLYVWDEPLNYLDVSARERLESALVSSGATCIFVEHDVSFTQRVATRVLDLG